MRNKTVNAKIVHGLTVELDVNNRVYFPPKTKVYIKKYHPTDFGVWEEIGREPVKSGEMTLSAFRAQTVRGHIIVEKDGEEITL